MKIIKKCSGENRFIIKFSCPNPNDKINGVGLTRKEQKDIEREAKEHGSLWPDLTDMLGDYTPRWKRALRHELLLQAIKLGMGEAEAMMVYGEK